MRFMAIVKSNPKSEAGVLPDEQMLEEMGRYNEQLIQAGAMLSGDGLEASSKGVRIRASGGKTRQIDGPFAEAKELVGGYWILQFASRDEAVRWLERAPFREGEVELRPLYELEDFPVDASEQAGGWRDQEQATRAAHSEKAPQRSPGKRRYLCILKADAHTEAGDEATPEILAEMGGLIDEMTKAGVMLSGEGLKPSREGVRIHYQGNKPRVVDGPFTESKELIAGFSVLQASTLQELLPWARRFLDIHMRGVGVQEGEVELRPMHEIEDFPVNPNEKPDGWRAIEQGFRDR